MTLSKLYIMCNFEIMGETVYAKHEISEFQRLSSAHGRYPLAYRIERELSVPDVAVVLRFLFFCEQPECKGISI